MNKPVTAAIRGEEHWTTKGADVRLFLWEEYAGDPGKTVGTILFVINQLDVIVRGHATFFVCLLFSFR